MSVFQRWSQGTQQRDAEAMISCLHADFTFIRHKSGATMNRAEMATMLRGFMGNPNVVVRSQRCLYENEEVLVEHSVMDFADGSSESVISFMRLRDGAIIETQTGATPMSR